MSTWKDLPQGVDQGDLRYTVLRSPCNSVRLALIMGIANVIDKQNRGKRLRFIYHGKARLGTLDFLRVHLSEVCLRRKPLYPNRVHITRTYITCSLFLTPFPKRPLWQYMTCDIIAPDGQRTDDIFIFLTEVLPKCLLT